VKCQQNLGEAALKRIEASDKLNRMFALYVLATASYSQGQYRAAFHYAQQSYQISHEEGDEWFSAYVLAVMGDIAWALEDYEQAWRHYQTSYVLKEDFNDQGGMATALNRMACMAWIREDYAEAARLYQQGYERYREVNDPGGLGMSLFGLGDTAQAQGDYSTAQDYFRQALEVAARIRWPQLILTILVGVGDLLVRTGEQEKAQELLTLVAQHPAAEPPARKRALALVGHAPDMKAAGVQEMDTVVESVPQLLKRSRSDAPRIEKPQQGLFEPLSERELEILRLLADGLTNEEVAQRLTLVVGTVKAHNHHIFGKLGVKNRVQAITRARELGLV
jgi:ATP/maltotriose-dependent transcriptional regulator MalT